MNKNNKTSGPPRTIMREETGRNVRKAGEGRNKEKEEEENEEEDKKYSEK